MTQRSVYKVNLTKIVSVGINAPIEEAIEKMKAGGFSQLPVTEGKKLVGMVTEKRLVKKGEEARLRPLVGSNSISPIHCF